MPRHVHAALTFAPPTALTPGTLGAVGEQGRSSPTPALVALGALDLHGMAVYPRRTLS